MLSSLRWSSLRWSRKVVDAGPDYVEQFRGPHRQRWTVSIRDRGALVVEPENLLDGRPLDVPLRSIRSAAVEHDGRSAVVVVVTETGTARIHCRHRAVAARIVARCALLADLTAPGPARGTPRAAWPVPGRRPGPAGGQPVRRVSPVRGRPRTR